MYETPKYIKKYLNYDPMRRRKRFTRREPILDRKTDQELAEAEEILSVIPHPTARKASLGIKGARFLGRRIEVPKTYTTVRAHWRRKPSGGRTRVKSHKRRTR